MEEPVKTIEETIGPPAANELFWTTIGQSMAAMTKWSRARNLMTQEEKLAEARIVRRRPPEDWPESMRHGLVLPQVALLVRNHGMHPDQALGLVVDACRKGARKLLKGPDAE